MARWSSAIALAANALESRDGDNCVALTLILRLRHSLQATVICCLFRGFDSSLSSSDSCRSCGEFEAVMWRGALPEAADAET